MKNVFKISIGSIALPGKAVPSILRFTALGLLLFAGAAFAQNSSYNLNSIPIGGVDNCAFGFTALNATVGIQNTAVGKRALFSNTNGSQNVAEGVDALAGNTTGFMNTAVGYIAMIGNTSGSRNTSLGVRTLTGNNTGTNNTALGWVANVGAPALVNATALGNGAVVNASDKIRFGNAAVTVIEGNVIYTVSDGRFKSNVSETDVKGLEFIEKLRPVVYNFNTRDFQQFLVKNMPAEDQQLYMDTDFGPSTAIRQSGFIAQEVEQAAKEIGYDFNGVHVPVNADDNYSISYSQFVVPLVKAVQEQQVLIEQQQQQINDLKKMVETLATTDKGNIGQTALSAHDVRIFPNPTGGIFTVGTQKLQGGVVEVYNLAGEKIHQSDLKADAQTHQVDLSAYPRGMYLVTVRANGKEITTQKLMLQ